MFSVKHLYPEPPGLEEINKLVLDPSYFTSLVNCTFHLDKNLRAKDYKQKAVGGLLLSYTTPAPSTSTNQAVQRGNDLKTASNKRMRIQSSPGTKMMIFGGLMPTLNITSTHLELFQLIQIPGTSQPDKMSSYIFWCLHRHGMICYTHIVCPQTQLVCQTLIFFYC
jgi:hypothetical protein